MKKILCFFLPILAVILVCTYLFTMNKGDWQNYDSQKTVSIVEHNEAYAEQEDESTIPESVTINENASANENNTIETTPPAAHLISGFPYIYQMPELPTGCEITAMTMLLNYYGYDADKIEMSTEYLPTAYADLYYDYLGVLHGTDLNEYFIGDPTTGTGTVCGTGAILTAANDYLSDVDASMKAKDISGYSPEDLYELIDNDTPGVVWITIAMQYRSETEGWYTDDGEYVEWSQSDHAGVLIGYSEDTVTIADPISGEIEYERSAFESVYFSRGSQAVILE